MTDVPVEWVFDLSDDIDLPGWLLLPEGLNEAERQEWIVAAQDVLSEISDGSLGDGEHGNASDVREVLDWGLQERGRSPSIAMFQVWPVLDAVAVHCHINILPSADLPRWAETDAIVHTLEAPEIGPGLQCSTTRTVEEDGVQIEMASVHLIFDNGTVTVMLSLDEAPAPLISFALPGFLVLMNAIRLERTDGVPFTSVAPEGVLEEEPWSLGQV